MQNWLEADDEKDSLIISSRIRLARNIQDEPFPDRLSEERARKLANTVENLFLSAVQGKDEYRSIHLWDNDKNSNIPYFEKHLISSKLIENSNKAAFIVNKAETVSIMINEEDHIRLQCISSGFDLKEILDYCEEIDDILEDKINYAFDERLGYLTACPTNLGTGLRASVMIHLPAMTMGNEMNRILNALTQVGMTIRGLYGEGSGAYSNIYQISNQITLGISETDILSNLKAAVNQLINQENLSRQQLIKNYKFELEDRIYRALGMLKSARMMDVKESLKLLSNVRMGVEMGIIKDIDKKVINKLLVNIQPATLAKQFEEKLTEKQLNFKRAEYIRKILI